jgi:glycosyltransferase involved in cell wall biosynthesis
VITRLIAGGADENTYLSAVGMDPRRFEVDLAVGRDWARDRFPIPSHIRLHVIPHLVRDIHPPYDVLALLELVRLMRRGGYDLVHTHTAKAGTLGRLAAVLAGVPRVVHTYHGPTFVSSLSIPRRAAYVAIERMTAALTDRALAVGTGVRDEYVRAGVVAAGECEVVYSGMDLGRFRQAAELGGADVRAIRREIGLPDAAVVVGCVSRLVEGKGHPILLEAIARIAPETPDLALILAGDGPLREPLAALAVRLGIADRVHFLGFRADVERIMAVTEILVHASFYEGLPRSLVQAAVVGRPILAFGVPGVREVVEHGENGYVVDVGDVDGLVAHLRVLLNDRESARAMGLAGRKLIDDRWAESRMLDALTEVYDELLAAA